jgi:hypothetical protein
MIPYRTVIGHPRFRSIRQITLAWGLLLAVFSSPARAETTILSVTGSEGSNGIGIFPAHWVAVSFTVGRPYVDVTISADLIGNFRGTTYLMTRVGPGTTVADEVASGPFVSAPGPGIWSRIQPVLHVNLLPAGTYVVVLSTTQSTVPQGMATTLAASIVADEGASNGPPMSTTLGTAGVTYPPAARFFNFTVPGVALEFQVTGTPLVVAVAIDIKPGSFPNSVNLDASGTIPVAILSTDAFNAPIEVDPSTLLFAGASVKVVGRGSHYQCSVEDVNADGLADLLCHFINELTAQAGDSQATVEGRTYNGQSIRGEDGIRILSHQ